MTGQIYPAAGLDIPQDLWEQMREQVSRLAPEEACGVLGGRAGQAQTIHPVENQLHSPVRFLM